MSFDAGDYAPGQVVRFGFNTHQTNGTPITLAGTPAIRVYKDGNAASEVATGATLVVDFNGLTGSHQVTIDTSADATYYSAGADFKVVLTVGTVDGVDISGAVLGHFTVGKREGILDAVDGVETSVSVRKALRAIGAAVAGLLSGMQTGTPTLKGLDKVTDRLVVETDDDNNRVDITYTLD